MENLNLTVEHKTALELHQNILANGHIIAVALVDFCGGLKEMRDKELYTQLGFENFDDYVEKAVGLRKRQAYNYIATYESWGPRLLEENASLGITKLEILSHLPATERDDVMEENNLGEMSTKQIKELVEQFSQRGEQLSLLEESVIQANATTTALTNEVKQLKEKLSAQKSIAKQEKDSALAAQKQKADLITEQTKKDAIAAARKDIETTTAAQLHAAEAAKQSAMARAAELEKQLQLASSEESTAFALHFDLLQQSFGKMQGAADALRAKGQTEQADKLNSALKSALLALAERV